MNATKEELAFDDVEVNVNTSTPQETIPAGVYNARLVGFKSEVKKPDWKITGAEGEDIYQYEWTLEITDGEYEGMRFRDFTNRTFHEKATAGKYAAALMGVPVLLPGMLEGTGALAGKRCQMWLVEKENTKTPGQYRNYIDKLLPTPSPRNRPQRAQAAQQAQPAPAVKRVIVPGLGDGVYEPDGEEDPTF
jgi:hypothetical protein